MYYPFKKIIFAKLEQQKSIYFRRTQSFQLNINISSFVLWKIILNCLSISKCNPKSCLR